MYYETGMYGGAPFGGQYGYKDASTFGLADYYNPGGTPVWQQLGFPDKASWKAAGSPTAGAIAPGPVVPPSSGGSSGGSPTIIGGGSTAGGSPITGAGSAPPVASSGGGIGDMLGSIPSSYLMIGAAILLLMMFKK